MTDRETNTLATRGLEEPFFPVVLLCQFFVLVGNRFWFYILLMYLEYHTVVVLCYFFWMWREIVFGVTYVLSVQYSCVAGKLILYEFFCWIRIFFSFIRVSQKYLDFLQPYTCNLFAKISRTFNSSRKSWIIVWRNIPHSYVYSRKLCKF